MLFVLLALAVLHLALSALAVNTLDNIQSLIASDDRVISGDSSIGLVLWAMNSKGRPAAQPAANIRRRLRVVIYARYSTKDQDVSSIDDQIAFCRDYLQRAGIKDADITVFSDAEYSGELRNSPGIDQIWQGIEKPLWDLLIAEDSSRLFRNETMCFELVETAVDNGMRVLCPNDDVDTDIDGWDDRLHDAAKQHAGSNRYTRLRILRRKAALWKLGAAMGLMRPGYLRSPTHPASHGAPANGPYFDRVDPELIDMMVEAYERIARLELPWAVAK